MSYEPLHHKYRPQTFADLVGQETIANTLSNALAQSKIAPAYLFTGPRGTGKTSSARILAKSLNCLNSSQPTPSPCGQCEACLAIAKGTALDVVEIDAASNTGVDNIREIIDRSRFAPVQCRYKVYVIDECHMLSTAAFNALLKTLEEPPPQVVFILATTDPQRVLSTIISRCQRFDYRRIPLEAMVSHLQYIAQAEKITITEEAITLVAQLANGGLRDAESLLDQLSLLPEQITVAKVWDLVGAVSEQDLLALLKAIKSDRPELVLQTCRQLLDRGREPLVVLQNLASFYLNLAIAKTAPEQINLVAVTEACWQELCSEATHWQLPLILRGQQQLKEAETQLKNTTQPRLWLEVTLLSLLPGLNQESATITTPVSAPVTAPQPSQELMQTKVTSVPQSPPEPSITQPETVTTPAVEVEAEVKVDIAQPTQITPSEKLSPQPSAIESTTTVPSVDTLETHTQPVEPSSPVNQQPTNDPVANQQLWSQVIACLHPPTTKALLSQHCHLISFNGYSAIVGISSANLQKLHQRKVPNIEAAFSQVCQQKVKVSLEVAIPQQQENHKRSPAVTTPVTPQSSSTISTSERSPSVDAASVTPPALKVDSHNEANQSQPANSTSPLPAKIIQTQTPAQAEVPVSQPLTSLESPHLETKLPPPSEATDTTTEDYSPDALQRAIESLTQNFEGEVVELEAKIFAEEEELETETIDIPANISNITLGNRPDLSNYDDEDDIPFVRPIYSRTNFGSQLCDSWELEANRYWDGVKQFVQANYLIL